MRSKGKRSSRNRCIVFLMPVVMGLLFPGVIQALDEAPYDPAILPPETILPPLPRLDPAPLANSGALELKFNIPVPPGPVAESMYMPSAAQIVEAVKATLA